MLVHLRFLASKLISLRVLSLKRGREYAIALHPDDCLDSEDPDALEEFWRVDGGDATLRYGAMMKLSNIGNVAMCMVLDDWVYIGEFCSYVMADGRADSHVEALPIALAEIENLVSLGLVEIGELDDGGWVRWESSTGESIRYIKSYADSHESWYYVAWLQITENGRQYAEKLDPDDYVDGEW